MLNPMPMPASLTREEWSRILEDLWAMYKDRKISYFDLADKAMELYATYSDSMRRQYGQPATVLSALRSVRAQQNGDPSNAFFHGLRGSYRNITHSILPPASTAIEEIAEVLRSVDRTVVYYPFVTRFVAGSKNTPLQYSYMYWMSREEDLGRAGVDQKIRAMLYFDMLSEEAERRAREVMNSMTNTRMVTSVSVGKEEDFWREKLIGRTYHQGVEFCRGYFLRALGDAYEIASEVYGEQWQEALDLWRAVYFMHGTEIPRKKMKDMRTEVFRHLAHGELESARVILRETALRYYPKGFTEQAYRTLAITEEDATEYVEQKFAKMQAVRIERMLREIRETKQLRDLRTNPEQVAKAAQSIGYAYIDKSIFGVTRSGSRIILPPRIYYISDVAEKGVKSIVLEGDAPTPSLDRVAAVVMKAYYLIDNELSYLTTSRSFPKTFLDEIENGSKIRLGEMEDPSTPGFSLPVAILRRIREEQASFLIQD